MAEKIGADTSYICVKALEKGVNIIGVTRGEVTKIHHTEKLDQGEVLIAQFTENTSAMKIRGKAEVYTQFGMIRAGEVDDHRRAAVDGAARAGVKVVGGRGVADVEVKMRMRVDKAGEEQLAAHVDDLCAVHCQSFADSSDLLAVHQHIRNAGACRRDDRAALEQRFHNQIILSCIGVYVSKISARRSSRSPPGRCRKACRILQS